MILAGDIGGTNTRLALFEPTEERSCLKEECFASREFSNLEEIIRKFLLNQKVAKACFGIAGAVKNERVQATNLPWVIDANAIRKELAIPSVSVLNDLEANAYGIRVLREDEFCVIQRGIANQKGNGALIAAGTGLGEAGLYWDGKEHRPFACEGGHADFSPRNELEIELLIYLKKKYGHVSYERVISGPGIYEIYQFLIAIHHRSISPLVQEEIKKKNPPLVISEFARSKKDPVCMEAVDCFISIYGAETGNLALKFLATSGVYLGGGIAPHFTQKMKEGPFLSAFIEKGRFKNLLSSIPVKVILNDRAALLGAAFYARRYQK